MRRCCRGAAAKRTSLSAWWRAVRGRAQTKKATRTALARKILPCPATDPAHWLLCFGSPKVRLAIDLQPRRRSVRHRRAGNLTPTARTNIHLRRLPFALLAHEIDYIARAKRCACGVSIAHRAAGVRLDLPSRGEPASAPWRLRIPTSSPFYDYSSDIDGPELPWAAGNGGDVQFIGT